MSHLLHRLVDVDFISKKSKFLTCMKIIGVYQIHGDEDSGACKVNKGLFIYSRTLWFFIHFVGAYFTYQFYHHSRLEYENVKIDDVMDTSLFILVFMTIDPIQAHVLKHTNDAFASILNEAKKLQNIDLGSFDVSRNQELFLINPQKSSSIQPKSNYQTFYEQGKEDTNYVAMDELPTGSQCNLAESSSINGSPAARKPLVPPLSGPSTKCMNLFTRADHCGCWVTYYEWLPVTTILMVVSGYIFIIVGSTWREVSKGLIEIESDWTFFPAFYYLILPVLTTWLCLAVIEFNSKCYSQLNILNDKAFYDGQKYKNTAGYISISQNISIMASDNIYNFTFGINLLFYILIGSVSLCKLLVGFTRYKNSLEGSFAEIIYVTPLLVSILHIFLICKLAGDLMEEHKKLLLKLKNLLVTLLVDDKREELKKTEFLYTNLKEWAPHVAVCGGFTPRCLIIFSLMVFLGFVWLGLESSSILQAAT